MVLEKLKQRAFNYKKPLLLLLLVAALSLTALAQKMPLRHLSTADGLPQNTINSIRQDEKGFFWIATDGGLARFDGYEFVNFTQEKGLPRNEILDILETREGDFWLAIKGGVVKFTPEGKIYNRVVTGEEAAQLNEIPAFITYYIPEPKNSTVSKLLQDSRGTIWVGTGAGLFQLRKNAGKIDFLPVNLDLPPGESPYVLALYEDSKGAVWVGTNKNLTRISKDKVLTTYRHEGEELFFSAMLEDRAGNFWVGTRKRGLFQFYVDAAGNPQIGRQFAESSNSEIAWIDTLVEADGKLWIGSQYGLFEFIPQTNKLFRYTRASGLGTHRFRTLFEDQAGDLWLGTRTDGIFRLSKKGLFSFETEDRISIVSSVGLDNEKKLFLTAFVSNTDLDEKGAYIERDIQGKATVPYEWRIGRLGENGFIWLKPKIPEFIDYYGWGKNQLSFQDSRGEWWIATGKGLLRFPKVEFEKLKEISPISIFDENSGLKPADVFRLFEDSRGDVWIATSGPETNGLYRWERATNTLRSVKPENENDLISSFAEDAQGNLWFSYSSQGFARFRNGKIDVWDNARGIPPGGVTSLFFDRENRLWLATRQAGVLRIDDPNADALKFTAYTEKDGLSNNRTLSLTQDKSGFIYIGTDRDINRLNSATGEFKQFELPRNQFQREYTTAVCDRDGILWFGTNEGLVKYIPQPDKPAAPPEILILGAEVEGVSQNVSARGTNELNLPPLDARQNQVRISYVSLANLEDENISYQYKFDEDAEWSAPNRERFINFANLSSGNYHIYIRAVASGRIASAHPAVVSFQIPPPVYLRWWFFAFVMLFAGAGIYTLYRLRVQKLLEMERARTMIATDLHDDIGSNLSKISVLSEVVRMQLNDENIEQNRLLNSIAETSRQSVSSMRDIVWAINPQRDSLLEMTRKMRGYAEEILAPKNIPVKFIEPKTSVKIKLPMHLRRDLYLIFKEAVNNVAKHSNCTAVEIVFQIGHREILLKIKDNGRGFDPDNETEGNGLSNMQIRVEKLKGVLKVETSVGDGTIVSIRIPQK